MTTAEQGKKIEHRLKTVDASTNRVYTGECNWGWYQISPPFSPFSPLRKMSTEVSVQIRYTMKTYITDRKKKGD